MTRAIFGKRQTPPIPAPGPLLNAVLVPRGAAASSDIWSMGEALHLFVTDAQERSLFRLEELPADAVAVFRAYELANELANWTLGGWHGNMRPDAERIDQTIAGLRLVGSSELADVAALASIAWSAGKPLDGFETNRDQEDALMPQCSAWVRHSPLTRVLGDGGLDTVYKETMKALGRCNPAYPRRRVIENDARQRRGLKPKPPIEGNPCTLEDLIAEMQARYG